MGLAERRAAKEFETNRYPALKKEIDAAASFDVPLEVKWETLALEGEAHLYDDAWTKVYFTSLVDALKGITVDQMGKDALRAGLKKVVIQNLADQYGERIASFKDGILTLDHRPTTNIDDVRDRAKAIQNALEKAL